MKLTRTESHKEHSLIQKPTVRYIQLNVGLNSIVGGVTATLPFPIFVIPFSSGFGAALNYMSAQDDEPINKAPQPIRRLEQSLINRIAAGEASHL